MQTGAIHRLGAADDDLDGISMLHLVRRGLAALVALYACIAMLAWLLDQPTWTSFGVSAARTSFATAGCALLTALAIFGHGTARLSQNFARMAVTACCLTVMAVCTIAFAQYAADYEHAGYLLGIDRGRLSLATAICFLLLAAGTLAVIHRRHYLGAGLAVATLMIAASAIIGYTYDVAALTRVFGFSAMALPTAMIITILASAVLLLEPEEGWLRRIAGGQQARRAFQIMMPAAIIVPFIVIGAANWAVAAKFSAPSFAFAIVTVVMAAMLGGMVILTCARLDRLDKADARLAAIVESSDDAIIGKGLDGIIMSWNRGAEQLFGYGRHEAIGQSMHIIVPEERSAEELDILAHIRRRQHIAHFETVRRRKDGSTLDVSATISPIMLDSGAVIGASSIIRDISARKLKDQELQRSNAELEQFAYVASHDLQEPLRMVANYVELLSQRYRGQLDERADKFIHYASDGARRMQQLVSDLLAYSRVGSQGKPPAPVDVEAVVDRVIRSLGGPLRASDGKVERGELPRALGDEIQLSQLFQNLVSNAIKFRGDQPPIIRITGERKGAQVHYAVSDNGIGMDMRFADRIFQMFQRLHERSAYEGSGIGLAIAKRIVERHDGSIRVESEPGKGTTMHFTLPAAPTGK
jgi:PAS domain S-box-containing protein